MFCAMAVSTMTYLFNWSPSTPLDFKLLDEVWSGECVYLSHLKVFGCASYIHIDTIAKCKLDAQSKKRYFIGYGNVEICYRFWITKAKRLLM